MPSKHKKSWQITALAAALLLIATTTCWAGKNKDFCEKNYRNAVPKETEIAAKTPPLITGNESIASLSADQVYSVPSNNGQCCTLFSFNEKLLKHLQNPHNSQLGKKIIHALANGVVPASGHAGLKRLSKTAWEIKILGSGADHRILGCEVAGQIIFAQYANDHKAVDRFLHSSHCS